MQPLSFSALMRLAGIVTSTTLLVAVVACQKDTASPTPAATTTTVGTTTTTGAAAGLPFAALPLAATAPTSNPSPQAKVDLGRALFWDPCFRGVRT